MRKSLRYKWSFLMLLQLFLNYGASLKDGDDLHSSVTALEDILKTERILMKNLQNYIDTAGEKIEFFKNFVKTAKENQDQMKPVPNTSTIADLIQAFKVKKRLSVSVPDLKQFFNSTRENIVNKINDYRNYYEFPSSNDLVGVTLGLLRVQEVYQIDAEQMASGEFLNISFGAKFSAADCFQLGFQLQSLGYHYYSIGWLKSALKRFKNEEKIGLAPEVDEVRLLDFLSYSQFSEGSLENAKEAVETAKQALSFDINHPSFEHIAGNLKTYFTHYTDLKNGKKKVTSMYPPNGPLSRYNLTETDLLKKLCRGDLTKSPSEQRNLHCRYETKNHPFLKLAPIKVEIVNINPHLAIFHDVLTDTEMDHIKNISTQNLVRAGVWNEAKGVGEPSLVRTSKYVWFKNESNPIFHRINQRVSDMTGLSMETAEDFQVMNYGTGGHYDIHVDYFNEPGVAGTVKPYGFYENGNRIATVLFYMSDVPHGGATAYPRLKSIAYPRKGTAAFWYNLYTDGDPDDRTFHSACPVISGSKWVMNKWIRIRSQEFRRPCKLYPDHV